MSYLVITLIVVAVLLVLYLIAHIVKPVGQALAFIAIVVSRVLVKSEEYLTLAADYCHKAAVASLRYPPGVSENDYWFGINVLNKLVIFTLAVTLLGAEPVNTLLVLPALFQTASTVNLPGIVELATAALFIVAPALWGCALLEMCGLIPHGAGM